MRKQRNKAKRKRKCTRTGSKYINIDGHRVLRERVHYVDDELLPFILLLDIDTEDPLYQALEELDNEKAK